MGKRSTAFILACVLLWLKELKVVSPLLWRLWEKVTVIWVFKFIPWMARFLIHFTYFSGYVLLPCLIKIDGKDKQGLKVLISLFPSLKMTWWHYRRSWSQLRMSWTSTLKHWRMPRKNWSLLRRRPQMWVWQNRTTEQWKCPSGTNSPPSKRKTGWITSPSRLTPMIIMQQESLMGPWAVEGENLYS